jgi:hypothetical protein
VCSAGQTSGNFDASGIGQPDVHDPFDMRYPMHRLFALAMSTITTALAAQQLETSILAPAGRHYSSGTLHMSYTLGEIQILTLDKSGFLLTQGFHQPQANLRITGLIDPESNNLRLYPVPAHHQITLEYEPGTGMAFQTAIVYNLVGQPLLRFDLKPDIARHELDISSLPSGVYLMQLIEEPDRLAILRFQRF